MMIILRDIYITRRISYHSRIIIERRMRILYLSDKSKKSHYLKKQRVVFIYREFFIHMYNSYNHCFKLKVVVLQSQLLTDILIVFKQLNKCSKV